MTDLGSTLSNLIGDHDAVEQTQSKTATSTAHFRSSTTNSYNKCLQELMPNFPKEVEPVASKLIDPFDQTNFEVNAKIEDVFKFDENTGKRYLAGKKMLYIKGTYKFKIFAHCKTLEMWIQTNSI